MIAGRLSFLLLILGLAGIYFLAGKAGLALAFVHPSATAVWPPTGIAVASALVFGYRVWPALVLGAFLVNVTTAGTVATSLGIAVGNSSEGVLGAYLVNRFAGGPRSFDRPRDVFLFTLLAALGAPTVSATLGVTSLSLGGYARWAEFGPIWLTWWLGDAAGALIIGPALILWSTRPTVITVRWALEAGFLLAAVSVVALVVFVGLHPLPEKNYPLGILIAPVLIGVALRLGPRETATAVLLVSGIAIWGTLHGTGPFARQDPNESLLLLQSFMGVVGLTSLVLAAAVMERREAHAHAQAALRERDEFLSVAAHELKTPITSLRLFAELLTRQLSAAQRLDDPVYRSAEVIDRQSDKLARLIFKLLDISRIEAGSFPLSRQATNVTDLVAEVTERARLRAEGRSIRLASPAAVVASIDPLRLEQVVTNLLDNAIRYSSEDEPIDIEVRSPSGGGLEIVVRDHGDGIPPEHRSHIFERFYQADVASYNPGLGLGLYISRHIIELHGGELIAEFPQGGGSQFIVRLAAEPEERGGADREVR